MPENDDAWQRFFEQSSALHEIAQNGHCYVSAEELKHYGQREPRLMAKIDTLAERPRSFKEHQLAILPTRNGHYMLFRDPQERSYYRFGDEIDKLSIEEFTTNADLYAYDSFPGPQRLNESQAIDFAYISTLLHHFTQEPQLYLAIRGRAYTNPFQFYLPIGKEAVEVAGVQIEIDAGYESPTAIYLIEAKIGRRDDFNIRQLFYPYLEWSRRSRKRIVPIFLVYTNSKYYLTEFGFAQDFGDLRIVKNACYVVNERPRPSLALGYLLAATPPTPTEPRGIPYPQADDLDKVLDVVSKVEAGISTKQELADAFDFDERQGDYYANAARYLDLLERVDGGFHTTDIGDQYLQTRSRAMRNELLVRQLLMRPTYRAVFMRLQTFGFDLAQLSDQALAAIIRHHTELGESTVGRRAKTMRSWLINLLRNAEFF